MSFENLNIGGKRYKVLKGNIICPDYMLNMIIKNLSSCIVVFSFSKKDEYKLLYEIDVIQPIRDYLIEEGANEYWLRQFLVATDKLLAYCGEFLIDIDYFVLDFNLIFITKTGEIKFLFNPFQKKDFHDEYRKFISDIVSNYFNEHDVFSEVFRQRILRETAKKDFNIRDVLSKWESFSKGQNNEIKKSPIINTNEKLFKGINSVIGRFKNNKQNSNLTTNIKNTSGKLSLTGICSIDTKIPIEEEGITVGRIMLQKEYGLINSGIGKIHARVYSREGSVYVTDLGSKNGTYLNGEPLQKRVATKIEKGDIVAFSDEEFILC